MVLLVATGTVCLLSNLLIVAIMTRQKTINGASGSGCGNGGGGNKLCLRYRLVNSQAWVGVLTSAVTVYPLKVSLNANHCWCVPCCRNDLKGAKQKEIFPVPFPLRMRTPRITANLIEAVCFHKNSPSSNGKMEGNKQSLRDPTSLSITCAAIADQKRIDEEAEWTIC